MNLTPNFMLEELTASDTATRMGIVNAPSATVAAHLYTLAAGLEKVRILLGAPMHILSGYRCETLEHVLCQKDWERWCGVHGHQLDQAGWAAYFATKAHPQGFAADFIAPAAGDPLTIVRKIQAAGAEFDQLLQEGTWVHISFAPAMRKQVLTVHFATGTGVPSYTQGA